MRENVKKRDGNMAVRTIFKEFNLNGVVADLV